jgi:phosphatidylglycerol---prolipoprotein diacylglyceryl transferase
MYPELFRIGGFPVNTYGVLLALAFLVALYVSSRLGVRDGLPRERIYDLGLWMLLAGLLGSKLLMMLVEPEYGENPSRLLSLDFLRSGGVWYGGLIGGVTAGYFLMRRWRLPFWKTADSFVPGIALAQSIGRQGCFAAGCCWGEPTLQAWGVHFAERGHEVTGVPVTVAHLDAPARQAWAERLGGLDAPVSLHPTQLYESFAMLAAFFFLLWLHRRKRFGGQVLLAYAVLYGAVRFTIEFFRADPRGDLAGLTSLTGLSTSQLISLAVGITGLVLLVVRWRRAGAAPEPDAEAAAARARAA